jgi:ethanolamine utilization protein EutQ
MACFIVREQEAQKLEKSALFGTVNEKAHLSQAIASPVSKNMTAGYLKLLPGYSKEIKSPVDEVDLFLEGSLKYTCEGRSFTAKKGDIAFIEKGSKVNFITEEGCFVFFVTYPLMQETIDALTKKQK